MGGSLGQLADGVSVSSGASNSSTTVEFSQRVVAIPPLSSRRLEPKFLFVANGRRFETSAKGIPYLMVRDDSDRFYWRTSVTAQYKNLQTGDVVDWSVGNSPLKLGVNIAYSFEEQCTKVHNLSVRLFMNRTYGIEGVRNGRPKKSSVKMLQGWNLPPFRFFIQNNPSEGLDILKFQVEHYGKE